MTKIHIAITCLTLIVLAGTSNAEILRCTGEINWNKTTSKKFMGETLRVQLDVVVPEKNDESFSAGLLSKDGKFERLGNVWSEFHKGTIEITESLGEGQTKAIKNQGRYDIVITQMPSKANSLIGFLIPDGSHIWSIRVDTWEKDKPIFLYRSDWNEFIIGTCKDSSL
jgi:hypothetical protein